jgi:hypothetical protein
MLDEGEQRKEVSKKVIRYFEKQKSNDRKYADQYVDELEIIFLR